MLEDQIQFLRRRAGMSQLQLARKLNVVPSAIGMYEQGRRTPALDVLIEMAHIFEVSLDYLITGREFTPSISESKEVKQRPACCLCRGCSACNTYR